MFGEEWGRGSGEREGKGKGTPQNQEKEAWGERRSEEENCSNFAHPPPPTCKTATSSESKAEDTHTLARTFVERGNWHEWELARLGYRRVGTNRTHKDPLTP